MPWHVLSSQKISEKPQVIADYECGKAIPNNQVLGKVERVLGESTSPTRVARSIQTRAQRESKAERFTIHLCFLVREPPTPLLYSDAH